MTRQFFIAPEFAPTLHRAGLVGMDEVFHFADGEQLDKKTLESWRQRWRIRLNSEGQVFYLKRFEAPPLRRQLGRWLQSGSGHSTAAVEWNNARNLAAAGIAAAKPAAFGEEMLGPVERRSFILLAEVPGESLERWLPANVPLSSQPGLGVSVRQLTDRLARFVAAFHRAGFVHRDLYLAHIFINISVIGTSPLEEGAGGDLFQIIDLQRVFQPRWRARRWVVKDLAALNFSTPGDCVDTRQRLEFLARYVRECGRFGTARQLAGLIARKTQRMARHNRTTSGAARSPRGELAGGREFTS